LRVGEDDFYEAKHPISLKSSDFCLLTVKLPKGTFLVGLPKLKQEFLDRLLLQDKNCFENWVLELTHNNLNKIERKSFPLLSSHFD